MEMFTAVATLVLILEFPRVLAALRRAWEAAVPESPAQAPVVAEAGEVRGEDVAAMIQRMRMTKGDLEAVLAALKEVRESAGVK